MLVLTVSDNPLRRIFNATSLFLLALLWTVILDRFFDVVKSHDLLNTEFQTSNPFDFKFYFIFSLHEE
jgi:hypothetical protein